MGTLDVARIKAQPVALATPVETLGRQGHH